jgi:uncharacterized membrane protein YgcG
MMAVLRAASWEAVTEEEPTRVKVVDTGKSVTVTVTADADTPAADATAAATLAVVKLLGLMPERDRPTVTTAAEGGNGGGSSGIGDGGGIGGVDDGGGSGGGGDVTCCDDCEALHTE